MFQPLADMMEKFATDFSWRRLIILLGFIILILLGFIFYEFETSTNQLSKYERTVVLLEKLNSLEQGNNNIKSITTHIYSGLENITNPTSDSISLTLNISREQKQALFASLPWILFGLIFLPGVFKGEQKARNIVGGSAIFMFLVGLGGYFIPVEWGSIIGFALYPILINIFLFAVLASMGRRK